MIRNSHSFLQICFTLLVASSLMLTSCGEEGDGVSPQPEGLAITSIEPGTGRTGQEILIKGREFGTSLGRIAVSFSGSTAKVVSVSDEAVTAVVPPGATTGKISVQTINGTTESSSDFILDNSSAIILEASSRTGAISFVVNGKAYLGAGRASAAVLLNDFWEFNPATKSWRQLSNLPGKERDAAFSFAIGTTGYFGGGDNMDGGHDMHAYNAATDTWTAKAPYPNGGGNMHLTAVALGDKAYVGFGGSNFGGSSSYYAYDPALDQWTSLSANYPGPERYGACSFTLNNKIYVGLGAADAQTPLKDFYSYDPATDTWTRLADFPGAGKFKPVAFTVGGKAYVGTGWENEEDAPYGPSKDMWTYDVATDTWTEVQGYAGSPRWSMSSFVINDVAYMGLGYDQPINYNDFWIFEP